jgi:hypothetical protein
VYGALVWALLILGSFAAGLLLTVKRRDGALTRRGLSNHPSVPPGYVVREARKEGVRALRRPDLVFLSIAYLLFFLLVLLGLIRAVLGPVTPTN